ncbi:Glycosyltransferase involved in cell wall bisynthesis [Lachnospiraceae bacterium XPB1003]|nr:Glycosyltransferase involved in cell wall bisynthesis [Lachnospiraceae bacterium XPB1003]
MNIVEINYTDLDGHIFNGYDLMDYLNGRGHNVWQVVRKKKSNNSKVIEVGYDWIVHEQIRELERKYRVENILFPYGKLINELEIIKKADVLHFHILHNDFVSLFDYPNLFNGRRTVWTIHDPWILTGGCIHPLSCNGWTDNCNKCDELPVNIYHTNRVRTVEMKMIKERVWKQISPNIIVSSSFMEKRLAESPMTKHITNVYKIPFGIKQKDYGNKKQLDDIKNTIHSKKRLALGFRVSNDKNKGCDYLFEALRKISLEDRIKLIAVGVGTIPEDIKLTYEVLELGWCQEEQMQAFWNEIDLFIMPSLAETFGLMAIESMASYVPVICFESTSVADITESPRVGMAVKWRSSEALGEGIKKLVENRDDIIKRAFAGRKISEEKYTFEEYAKKHERLFESIVIENRYKCI